MTSPAAPEDPMAPSPGVAPSVGWRPPAVIACLLLMIAAALAVAGSFAPLFQGEISTSHDSIGMTVTGWGFESAGGSKFGAMPVNGIPLAVGAGLLLVAAVAAFLAAPRWSTIRVRRAAGALSCVATAFAAGAIATVTMQVSSWEKSFVPASASPAQTALVDVTAEAGIGLWILVAAIVVAAPATALALRLVPPAVARA